MERRPVLDTAPRSWGELLDDERQLLEGLNRFIGHCLDGAARIEARQQRNLGGRRPRIDRVREGRVAMLNGPRGTGKTTLLLTAMAWWTCPEEQESSRADPDDGPSGGPRAFAEIGQRIACLDLLDFDPQPPGMPVYAWLVHAFQPLVDAIDATTPRDACQGDEPDLLTRWNRLAENAAIGWQTESRWPLPSADAEIDASQKTERWLNLSHQWRAFIDALLQAEPTIELVLVPVDDIDMQPRGALDLLQAMRVFYHPRVLFVLTGDRAHLERVVRRELAGRMSQASTSIEPNEAPELAKALVDKSIPRAQTFPVRALSWLEALDWQSGVLRERLGERARGWNAEGLPALTEPTLPIRSVAHVVAGATTAEALMAELVEHARPQGWLSVRDLPEPLFGFEVQVPGSLVAYAVSHGGADLGPMIAHHTGVGWAPAGTRLDGLHSLTEIQRAPPAVVALAEAGVLGTNRIFGHVVGGLVQSMYNWHGRTVFLPWPMMTFSRPSTPARMLRRFRELYEDVNRFAYMFAPSKDSLVEVWLALHIETAASERGLGEQPKGSGWAKLVEFARENLIVLGPRFAEWLRDRLPILAAPEFGLSAPMQGALLALGESVALPPGKSDVLAGILDRRKANTPWDDARRFHLDREAFFAGGDRLDLDSFTNEVERQATNSPWYTRYRSEPEVDAALEKWLDVEVRGRTVYSWLSRADLETGTLSERVRLLHRRDGQGRWDLDHWGTHRIQAVLEKVDWTKSLDPMQRTSSASAHFWMARIWSTLVAACLELDMLSGELAAEIGGWVVLTDGWLDSEWAGPRLTCVPELDVDPEHQWMMEGTDLVLAVPNAWKVECPELSDVEPAGRDALGAWAMVLQSVWHDLGRPEARLQFERPRVLDPEDVLPMPPLATWVEAERYCIWWRKNIETLASAQLPQGSAPVVARAALVERWLDRIPEIMKPTPDGRAIDEPDAPDYPRPPDRLRNAARGLPGPDKAPDLVDWWAEVNPGALLQGAQREAVEAGLVEARQPPGIEIVF